MKSTFLTATIASGVLVLFSGCAAHQPPAPPIAHAAAPALPGAKAPSAATTARQVPPPKPVRHPEQDRALAAAARKAYDSGVARYQTGDYPAARADFNRAFDIFTTSGKDLKRDPALHAAFQDTVDKINALEMDSVDQSNGFSQQEESPVGVANDITFPVDPKLLARAQADLKVTHSDLPLVVNKYVASYINYFTNTRRGHNTIENSLIREGRYKNMVEGVLTKAGLPKDLIYLAIAESGFRPKAVNPRSGAGGMWQFMPYDGYGLTRNAWVDQRFDPKKSTEAYARYIKYLHKQFGDWYLAMAAYNWGPGHVQRAVERTGYADFWELYRQGVLPKETRNYVPIILAAAIMAKNPSQYGLADLPVDPPLVTDTVTTDSEINLDLVADLTGTTAAKIRKLNPALLRTSTPRGMKYDLHLPKGTGKLFERRIAMIPEKDRRSWRFHVAASGDTLESVARKFHVTRQKLEAANNLQAGGSIHAGEPLVIPVPARRVRGGGRYRIRRGDTLGGIARRFGVSVADLRRWNGLRSNRIVAGRHLYVSSLARRHRRDREVEDGSGYRIRRGDTLGGIARRFGVSVADLRRWNGLRSNRIVAGRRLSVSNPAHAHRSRGERRPGAGYRVRSGDTLSGIADRFGVSVADLRRWNDLRSNRIVAGRKLYVSNPAHAHRSHADRRHGAHYRIHSGDTLGEIADRFNVTVAELRRWNDLRSNRIVAGQRLRVSAP